MPPDCCPDLKLFRGVFGIDLTTHVKAYKTNRPFVIDKCVEEIEKRGMSIEGIYRVSGFQEEMDSLRLALDKGKYCIFICISLKKILMPNFHPQFLYGIFILHSKFLKTI